MAHIGSGLQIWYILWKLVPGVFFALRIIWDHVHVWKMAGLPSNATERRILTHFDVSMILCSYLAQIFVVRVFLYENNIGTPLMLSKWPICCKAPPLARFSPFRRFTDLMLKFGPNLGFKVFLNIKNIETSTSTIHLYIYYILAH